jgi:hypothetical protein
MEIRANTISNRAGTGPVDLEKTQMAKCFANLNQNGWVSNSNQNVSSFADINLGEWYAYHITNMIAANYPIPVSPGWPTNNWVNVMDASWPAAVNYASVKHAENGGAYDAASGPMSRYGVLA